MIVLDSVSLSYPKRKRMREVLVHPFAPTERVPAVKEINLVIRPGERVALLGPNGAGKTTTLKLIGGLFYPTRGSVRVDGLDTVTRNRAVRAHVGYVMNEERSFYWRLTGRENLAFFGALENLFGDPLEERITTLLAAVDLCTHADKCVSDYSAGMRQRLAIARGLLADPRILLLDEPTKSLDLISADEIRHLVRRGNECEHERTLVLTTNQLHDAAEICERICILDQGQLVADWRGKHLTESEIGAIYRSTVAAPATSQDVRLATASETHTSGPLHRIRGEPSRNSAPLA